MATGLYAQTSLIADTNTTVFTTAATSAIYNIRLTNRNVVAVTVQLALAAAATPVAKEYIEFDVIIPANGVLEEQGLSLQAGILIVAQANTANVSVAVWGVE